MRPEGRLALAALCAICGISLAFAITSDISVIGPRSWYGEFLVPLGIAAVVGVAISARWPSANASGYGLLVTAPPYLSFLSLYLRHGEYAGIQRLTGIAIVLGLAGSGAVIGYLIARVFAYMRRDAAHSAP